MTKLSNNRTNGYSPDFLSPPGDTIADLLEEQEMTQVKLAERLGVTEKHLSQVINGHVRISPDLALGLERVLGPSTEFWLSRESHYQASLMHSRSEQELESWIEWAKKFPIQALKERDFISADARGPSLVGELLSFLGVAGPDQWKSPDAAYRKSMKLDSDEYSLAAWLRIGELEARAMPRKPYDAEKFRDALASIKGLTREGPEVWQSKLTEWCGDAGVSVVIVDALPKARANGATRWLSPNHALIQLSLRYSWEDIFWFSFFHEAAHVLKHPRKGIFIEPDNAKVRHSASPETQRLEEEADKAAAQYLIPQSAQQSLAGLRRDEDVRQFADQLGIAPAIVVGRLQHDSLWPRNRGNHLRRRLKFVNA